MGALLPDGKIVLAGATRFGGIDPQSVLVVTELDQSGSVVKSFGRDGSFATTKASCLHGPTGLTVQGSRILVAADRFCAFNNSPESIILMRLGPEGRPDTSFGHFGSVRISGLPEFYGRSITQLLTLPHGRVVVATAGRRGRLELVGLLANGTLNPHFGHKGVASTHVAVDSFKTLPYELFRGKAGSLTVGGCVSAGTFLARFTSSGWPIDSWQGGPIGAPTNVENFGGAFGEACVPLAQLANGEFVAAGNALVRLSPGWVLDASHPIVPFFVPGNKAAKEAWYLLAAKDGTFLVTLLNYHSTEGTYDTFIGRYRQS